MSSTSDFLAVVETKGTQRHKAKNKCYKSLIPKMRQQKAENRETKAKQSTNQKINTIRKNKSLKHTTGRSDSETQEHKGNTEQEQQQEMHDKQNRLTKRETGRQGLKYTSGD